MFERRAHLLSFLTLLSVLSRPASSQLPGAPVLQNVWASRGGVGAFNLAGGSGGSVYAAAASWTLGSYVQLSGGLGIQALAGNHGDASRPAYAARLAATLGGEDATFGFGAFAGVGGGGPRVVLLDALTLDTVHTHRAPTRIPVGISVGWRRAIGESQGLSVYTTPSLLYLSGGDANTGLFRMGIGADFAVTETIGVTGGLEFGQTRRDVTNRGQTSTSVTGPNGTIYGLGVSYAFGRR